MSEYDDKELLTLARGPQFRAQADGHLLSHVSALAAQDPAFRARLLENANSAIESLGFRVPEGVRYLPAQPCDRIIPLVEFGAGHPTLPSTEEQGAQPTSMFASGVTAAIAIVKHRSSFWIPQGHRGKDEITLRLDAGTNVTSVDMKNVTPWGNFSGASLSGWHVDGNHLVMNMRWWFNGWSQVVYSLAIHTKVPPVPSIPAVVGDFDAMLGMGKFRFPPTTNPRWEISTSWDWPIGYP